MITKKEIEFECGRCWDLEGNEHTKFKTDNWFSYTRTDDDGELYVAIETSCPKCRHYCYRRYYLNQLFNMIAELQEKNR